MTTRIRTWILLAGLSALLVSVGALIGGPGGLLFFLVLAIGMNLAMYWWSDKLALKMSRARPLGRTSSPPSTTTSARSRTGGPAAAAALRDPVRAAQCVRHRPQPASRRGGRDRRPRSLAPARRGARRARARARPRQEPRHPRCLDRRDDRRRHRRGGALPSVPWLFGGDDDESPLGIVGTLAAIILAPLAAMVLQLAVSRQREYLADETAAGWLGEGRPARIGSRQPRARCAAAPMEVNPATASLYIASPLSGRGMSSLFSTHPPIPVRIERLRTQDARRASTGCCTGIGGPAPRNGHRRRRTPPPWPSRRRRSTGSSARSTCRSPGPSRSCPSASGRSTSTGCTRTSASSCRSSWRCCSIATCPPAGACSIRLPGRERRSSRPSSRATTRPASTWRASTAC